MPSFLDRFATGLVERAVAATQKASTGGTGAGVLAYYNDVPLWSASRNPQRLMRQAQGLYHSHPWVHAAEHIVSSRAAGVEWHLEDDQGETVDDKYPDKRAVAVRDLLEKPQASFGPAKRQTTGRELRQLTFRHKGLCGNGFWYKDQRDEFGTPRSFLYINPARMTPRYDKGANLLGWKLDATDVEGSDGVPIAIEEVLHFTLDPADNGVLGIGIVESMGLKAQLSELGDRHLANVFGSGGRLTGIISPKAASNVSDDDWQAAVRDWRNIAEDPQAGKRLQILKQPVDYMRTTGTLQELAVEAVTKMSREDIFAGWQVPLSQVGISVTTGLNSGETKGFDEAVLWQGAIHNRLTPFKETLQFGLLDPLKEAGLHLTLVIDEPEFDDETPLYERAGLALNLPLTRNQRLNIIGLDPLPDYELDGVTPLGTAIDLPSNLITVGAGPGEDGKLKPVPEPPPAPPTLAPPPGTATPDAPVTAPAVPAKARLEPLRGLRRSLDQRWTPAIRKSVSLALREQRSEVSRRIRDKGPHLAAKPGDTTVWWNAKRENDRLSKALAPHSEGIATQVAERAKSVMRPGKASFESTVAERVRKSTGQRIVGINETTRDAVAQLISQGFDDGLSPAEVADLIESATPFDEARAELIARTESALAYNEAALGSYGEFGVTHVEAIDGDEDPQCADRNGQVYDIDEAQSITDHPNGTLDWAPVIEPVAKADPMVEMLGLVKAAIERPMPRQVAPIVNVTPAPVVIPDFPAPVVTFEKGAIEMKAPDVTVNVPRPGKATARHIRDKKGQVTGTETTYDD